ncbi:hypothetical protein ACEQPO_05030 [Bacillus sp. SL00103]
MKRQQVESLLYKRISMKLTGYHESGLRDYIKLYEKDPSFKIEVDRIISLVQTAVPIKKTSCSILTKVVNQKWRC